MCRYCLLFCSQLGSPVGKTAHGVWTAKHLGAMTVIVYPGFVPIFTWAFFSSPGVYRIMQVLACVAPGKTAIEHRQPRFWLEPNCAHD